MFRFMEKWFCGIVMSFVMVAAFFMSAMQVRAGEIVGSEGAFTHSHTDTCYETVTLSCESKHVQNVLVEQGIYFCATCNGNTSQHIVVRKWTCPVKNVSWEKDCYIACNTCGTYYTTWTQNPPGSHYYTEKVLHCGLQEGEKTATLKIVADDSWTNQGVNLIAKCNILKQDLSSNGITTGWEGDSFIATENGTYSVTATNSQGGAISSTISISCIDKIPPVIVCITGDESTMSDKSITVTASVSDGESGLDDAACSLDGGASWGEHTTFNVEEGKTIQFAVRDKAGNVSTATITRSQFPYPPKPVVPSAPAESVTSAPSMDIVSKTEAATAKKVNTAPARTSLETSQEKEQVKESKEELQEELEQTPKVELTLEEQKQAYGISLVLQRKARDEFFAKSKVRRVTGNGAVSKNETMEIEESILLTPTTPVAESPTATSSVTTPVSLPESGVINHFKKNAGTYLGVALCTIAVGSFVYLLWLHSAVLYCYEGGEEYRKIGFFHIKRGKNELELYLPDYILQSTKAFRYRLMLKNRLVKKCGNCELVVYNEDSKLRQQVEECVDFVL